MSLYLKLFLFRLNKNNYICTYNLNSMCEVQINIIKKNRGGQLSFCPVCKVFNLTFKNILIEMTARELKAFQLVVTEVDINYWESHFNKKIVKRNIPILTSQQNLILIFSLSEYKALKELVIKPSSGENDFISVSEIDYDLILN